jgi:hypothetical protein
MSSTMGQLGAQFARLSSLERRFIIIVAVIVFVVINLVFVLPYFSELGKIKNRFADANTKLGRYEKEIAQTEFYQKGIKEVEGEGTAVPREDQAVELMTAIRNQATQSRVTILTNNRQPERTNQFFLERAQALTTQSGESELVDFLYNLGAGSSLIRVRALSIRPDAPRQALNANMTLIASFQKKAAVRAAPAPAAAPARTPPPAVQTNKPAVPAAAKPVPATPKQK